MGRRSEVRKTGREGFGLGEQDSRLGKDRSWGLQGKEWNGEGGREEGEEK